MLSSKGTTQCTMFLLLVLTSIVYGQTQTAGTAEVVGSATIQAQGGSVADLQAQLANATKTAVANIEQNPQNLNSALQNLLAALGNAVFQILVEILQDGTVDAQNQSQQIASQVGQTLETISSSATGELATLDAAAVQRDLQNVTFNILNNVTAATSTSSLIQNLANEVLQKVGDALAKTLGLEFRASVSLAASAESPSPTPSITGSSSGEISSDEIVVQLSDGNGTRAADILNQLLLQGKNQEIVDLFKQAFEDATLESQMEQLLFSFYAQDDYLSQTLSVPLGTVFTLQPDNLARLLSRVVLNVDGNATLVPNLITALEFGLTSQGDNIQNMFTTSISLAIIEKGCEAVGLLLVEAFDKAKTEGLGSLFTLNLEKSQQISECLEVGTQLQLSAEIVTSLQQPRVAGNLVFRSIQEGNIAGVSGALVSAIEGGSGDALQQTLSMVLQESSLNVSVFVDAFNEAYLQTSEQFQLAQALAQVLSSDQLQDSRVTEVLLAGLSQNQTEQAFTQVVVASTDGNNCPLEDSVDAVVQRVADDEYSPVFQQLRDNSEFRKCVTGQTLVSVLPAQLLINISATVTPEAFNPEKGAQQLSNSIQRGSVDRASTFLQEFITEQQANTSELTLTLTLLLNTPDLSLKNFALVFSQAAQSAVGEEIIVAFQAALQILQPNINLIVQLFEAAFADDSTSPSFQQVILDSIKDGRCELLNVFDTVVEQSGNNSIVIQQLIENEQLQECVNIETLAEYVPISLLFNTTSFALRLLQSPDVAAQIMYTTLQKGQIETSANIITDAFSEVPINGSELLADVIEFLFDYEDFDMQSFISALLQVVEDDTAEKTQVIQFLSDVFASIDVNITQMALFLDQGLQEFDTSQFFVQMIFDSIKGNKCGLGDALDAALQQSPETSPLFGIFLENPEIYECVDEDTFITATVKAQIIPSQILDNPTLAANTLLATLQANDTKIQQEGSIETVSSLLVNATDEGFNSTKLSVTITLLLSEDDLDIDNFVLSIALALQRLGIENSELEQALVTSLLSNDLNKTVVEEVLEIGLSNNDTSDEFVQVALGSIEDAVCGLLQPLTNVAARPEDQATFIQLLEENENLTACVSQDTLKNILPASMLLRISLSSTELFENATLAADLISSAIQEGSIDTLSNFLVGAVDEDINSTYISTTLQILLSESEFDIDDFSLAIGLALESIADNEQLASTFAKVITSSEINSTIQFKILEAGLLNNQTQQAFLQVISSSIEGGICSLKNSFDQIVQQPDVGTTIAQALIEDANLRKCVSTEVLADITDQFITFNISFATEQILSSPQIASQIIFSSLQEGSVESVSSLLVNAIEEDEFNSTEISNTLSLVLAQPEINVSNFALSIALALNFTSQQTEFIATVTELLASPQVNATTRTQILQEGFSNNQTVDTFVQIVLGSIEGNVCQLRDEFDEAIQNIDIDDQLVDLLKEYPELAQCLSLETSISLSFIQQSQQASIDKQTLVVPVPEEEEGMGENEDVGAFNFGGAPEVFASGFSTMQEKAALDKIAVIPAPEEEDKIGESIDEMEEFARAFSSDVIQGLSDQGFLEEIIEESPVPEEEYDDDFIELAFTPLPEIEKEDLTEPESTPALNFEETNEESPAPEEEADDFVEFEFTLLPEIEQLINYSPTPEFKNDDFLELELAPAPEFEDDDLLELDTTPTSEFKIQYFVESELTPAPEFEDDDFVDLDTTPAPEPEGKNFEKSVTPAPEFEEEESAPVPEFEGKNFKELESTPVPEFEGKNFKELESTPAPEFEDEDFAELVSSPAPEFEDDFETPEFEYNDFEQQEFSPVLEFEDDDLIELKSTPIPESEKVPSLEEEIAPTTDFEEMFPASESDFTIGLAFNQSFQVQMLPEVNTASDLVIALQGQSVQNASQILLDFISDSIQVDNSNFNLSTTISLLFQEADVNVDNLAIVFGSIINSTSDANFNSTVVIDTLAQTLTSQDVNLTVAIDLIESGISDQQTADSFFQIVLSSIEGNVCKLEDAFTEAVLMANDTSFIVQALQENEQLQECVEPSVLVGILPQEEFKLNVNISTISTKVLAKPQVAAETVFTSLQEGQVGAVTNLISEAANDTNNALGLTATFQFLFNKPDVNVENFAVAFDSAVNASAADEANLTSTLIKSLSVPELNVSIVGDLLDVGLSNNNTQQTFIKVLKGSIEGNICSLQGALDSAVEQSKSDDAIIDILEQNQDLQQCVSQDILLKAAPNIVLRVPPITEQQVISTINTSSSMLNSTLTPMQPRFIITTDFGSLGQLDDLNDSTNAMPLLVPVSEPEMEDRPINDVQVTPEIEFQPPAAGFIPTPEIESQPPAAGFIPTPETQLHSPPTTESISSPDTESQIPTTETVTPPDIEQQLSKPTNQSVSKKQTILGGSESDLEEPGFVPTPKLTGKIFVPVPTTEQIRTEIDIMSPETQRFYAPQIPMAEISTQTPIPISTIFGPTPSPIRASTPSAPVVEVCPRMEFLVELQNGKQYLYGENVRYDDAVEACICIGGKLVEFGDSSEELLVGAAHEIKKLQKMILGDGDKQSRYWMGLYNPSGEISLDAWQWLNQNEGEITYENWRWDEPSFIVDGKKEEECGEADAHYNECSGILVETYLAWSDASCQEYQQYICERNQPPRLQSIQGQVEFLYVPPLDRAYVFLKERKYSFYSAKLACDNMKGQMVQFRSRVEEDLVYGALASVLPEYAVRPIWMGLQREETECIRQCNQCDCAQQDNNCGCSCNNCALDEGEFYWVSGRKVGPYVNWMGQPCSGYKHGCLPPGRCVLTNVKKTPYNIKGQWTPHQDCGQMAYALCEIPGVYYST